MLDIADLVASLRAAGGDTTAVEVKSAAGGIPQTLASSLSAFANLPGGGRIILGLTKRPGSRQSRSPTRMHSSRLSAVWRAT
jgi:ATP-dependent DNA helicase RecG